MLEALTFGIIQRLYWTNLQIKAKPKQEVGHYHPFDSTVDRQYRLLASLHTKSS